MLNKDLKLKDNIANFSSFMAAKITSKNGNPMQSEKEKLEDQTKKLKASIAAIHEEGFEALGRKAEVKVGKDCEGSL